LPNENSRKQLDQWAISFPGLRFAIPMLIVLIGTAIVLIGFSYPHYTDAAAVNRLRLMGAGDALRDSATLSTDYFYDQLEKYKTPHDHLVDIGSGCISLGFSLCAFLAIFRIHSYSDLRSIRTPGSQGAFMGLLNMSCILFLPAQMCYFSYTQHRGDYPPWADSIAIPIFQMGIMTVILLLILNVVFAIVMFRAAFPVKLFDFPIRATFGNVTCTVVVAITTAFLLYAGVLSANSGAFLMIPILLSAVYLLISTRAALLAFGSVRS
jgi:hypothetical protein